MARVFQRIIRILSSPSLLNRDSATSRQCCRALCHRPGRDSKYHPQLSVVFHKSCPEFATQDSRESFYTGFIQKVQQRLLNFIVLMSKRKDKFELTEHRINHWQTKTTRQLLRGYHEGWFTIGSVVNKIFADRGFDVNNLPRPEDLKDIDWFKRQVAPLLIDYDIKCHHTLTDDTGRYQRAAFSSDALSGHIDFWDMGHLHICVWESIKEQELMNIILEPADISGQHAALRELFVLLGCEIEL